MANSPRKLKRTPIGRSENMRRIKSKDTRPELVVRQILRSLGFRGYRLHRKDLPGKPDIAFIKQKKAVMVHGCFWHGHDDPDCTDGRRKPKSNLDYWLPKLARNKARDADRLKALQTLGWEVLTVWDCDTEHTDALKRALQKFLG